MIKLKQYAHHKEWIEGNEEETDVMNPVCLCDAPMDVLTRGDIQMFFYCKGCGSYAEYYLSQGKELGRFYNVKTQKMEDLESYL